MDVETEVEVLIDPGQEARKGAIPWDRRTIRRSRTQRMTAGQLAFQASASVALGQCSIGPVCAGQLAI